MPGGLRQFDLLGVTSQQHHIHITFQFLDLAAQCRLRDVQALRSPGITAGRDDFNKVFQLSEGNHGYAVSR